MSNLILGDGLLGKEIIRQSGWDYTSRKRDGFDFCDINSYFTLLTGYDQIINCIAFTKTYSDDKERHWNTNYKAVCDLVDYCSFTGKKLIHISTDYVYGNNKGTPTEESVPVHCENWYSYTKLLGESYVELKMKDYLVIRTSFKPVPFPYPQAYTNMVGMFDYSNVVAGLIIELINKNAVGIYNVGTPSKTMYELAKRTKPDVLPIEGQIHPTTPIVSIMNIEKMRKFLDEN